MLVCRDLEKAKEKYGFEQDCGQLKVLVTENVEAVIFNENVFYLNINEECYLGNFMYKNALDFIYDMIKDGILEKVEA